MKESFVFEIPAVLLPRVLAAFGARYGEAPTEENFRQQLWGFIKSVTLEHEIEQASKVAVKDIRTQLDAELGELKGR